MCSIFNIKTNIWDNPVIAVVHHSLVKWSSLAPELTQQTPLRQPSAGADHKTKIINPSAGLPNSNIANIAGTFLTINVVLENLVFAGPKRNRPTPGFSILVRSFVCSFVRPVVRLSGRLSPLVEVYFYTAIIPQTPNILQILSLL